MICGLVLAAGEGTRFGPEPKLLAELDGRPLLKHAVDAQCGVAQLSRVLVVLGANAEAILRRVDFGRAEIVVCPSWAEGQAASLRFGLARLSEAEKVIVTLGDEPLMTSEIVARFLGEPSGTRATYGGRPGHPVVLGVEQTRAIGSLKGDRGARDLLRGARTIECDPDAGRDVDTPEDLEAIRNEARAVI